MDTGVKSVEHISERLSDDQSVEPTTSHVSTNRDMNIKPTKASRRLLGMSTAVDPPSCLHNPISYNVTLRHGLRSGRFKDQGRVDSFEVCFSQCCHDNDCNLVYMLHNYCYLVSCYDQESCALNPLVATVDRELAVAFVYKERNNELLGWNRAPMNHTSSLPAYFETDKALENEPSALNQQNVGMSGQIADSSRIHESTYGEARPTYEDKPETFPIQRMHYPIPQRTVNDNPPPTANDDVSPVTRNAVQYPGNSPTCIPGVERYFTTLEGGLSPGYFEEMKFITNMETCKAYCCQKPDCDVALMQQEECYLVTCPRSELCRDVPAGFLRGITRISHMKREGRSFVNGEGINGNLGEVIGGNRDSFRLGGNRKSMDDISKSGVDNNPNFYNFENPVEGTSDTRESQGGHDLINSHSNGDSLDSKVRNVIRDKQNYERNGLGDSRDFHHSEGIQEDQDIVKNMERKDIIPTAYQNNLPLDTDDKRYDEEMNLLQDAIGDIEQRKHLHDEEESYGMRISSEIPTPPSQTKTDFEKIFSKDRTDPLIFDDLAGKRHQNLQEGLGDMASDILSNILKHRATDSIESIWSSKKDPLEHEVTKAKETNTPEKIEKELQQPQEHVASAKQHKVMSSDIKEQSVSPGSNAKMSEEKQATSGEKNGGLDDQSKLIETLYNLVKESSKTESEDSMKNKGSYDKQRTHLNEQKTDDENMDPETSESRASDAEDEFPDYFNSVENSYDSLTPSHLGTHFRHVHKSHPRLEVNEEDNVNYGGQDYHDNLDDEIYDEVNPNRNVQQDLGTTENGEREQKLHENAYQSLHDRKIKEKRKRPNSILDQDLDFITDKLGEQEIQDSNTYGPNNEINQNEFSDYDDNNFDYSDHSPNMDYYDPIGVKRKLLHVRPAHVQRQDFQVHHKSTNPYWLNSKENAVAAVDRKPLVFIESKQPAGQENDNLVMNELEKIEDELSDIKTRPKLRENSVKHRDSSNLVTKFQPKDDVETKQSIVDILANLKDVSNSELNKNGKAEASNKSNKLIVAKSNDEKLILNELKDIKKAIGNMSNPSSNLARRKITPKVDDIGDDISELLDENWDIDKRSRIPKPNTADQLARGRSRAGLQGSLAKDDDTRGKIYFVGMYLVS